MSTSEPPIDESAIGRFFRQLQDKLHSLFADIETDLQGVPPGFSKTFIKNGQLIIILLSIVVTIMFIIFAIMYKVDKAKLSKIELPYNTETISYQALDFTNPKYKGKYQYFPMIVIISLILLLITTVLILTMAKFSNIKVKSFYFMMTLLYLIPSIVFIIMYVKISKYLKPRNEAKEKINAIFYKYMIDDLSAKSQLSVIPDGGRYSVYPMLKALEILATQTQFESEDVKQKKLTKAIVSFTLYKYYIQKSMEDYLLEKALAESFSKYAIKGIDYCKYLPNNLRSLTTVDISKIVQYDRNISSIFTSPIVNKARKNASIILREVNGLLDNFNVNEDTVKKFIMTNTVVWISIMVIVGLVLAAAMSYRSIAA